MKKRKDFSILIIIGIFVILVEVFFLSRDLSKFEHKLAEEDIKFKARIAQIDSVLATLPDLLKKKKNKKLNVYTHGSAF